MSRVIYKGSFKDVNNDLGFAELAAMSTAAIVEKIQCARNAEEFEAAELYQQALFRNMLHVLLIRETREHQKWVEEMSTVTITQEDIVNHLREDYIGNSRSVGYMINIYIPDQEAKEQQIILPI